MKRRISIFWVVVLCLCILSGCGCRHEWTEANCTTARTCSLCETVEGEPLGHHWADATCETARFCTLCGETRGEALQHTWQAATCEMPKTCSVCAATEGEASGHSWTDWSPAGQDAQRSCDICGEEASIPMSEYLTGKLRGRWVSTRDIVSETTLSQEIYGGKFPALEFAEDGTIRLFTPDGMYPSCNLEYRPPASGSGDHMLPFTLTADGTEESFHFFYDPIQDVMQGYLAFWYQRESPETAGIRAMLLGKWTFDSVYLYDESLAEQDHGEYTVEFLEDGTFTADFETRINGTWVYFTEEEALESNGTVYYHIAIESNGDWWSMYCILEVCQDTGAVTLRFERPRVERVYLIKSE